MEDTIEIPQKVKNRCSYSGLFIQNAAAANLLQSCPTLCNHRQQPTRLPHPWDSPGKNTGVGCHFLLQCMKVKSESEVIQSYLTLHDPMDRSLPGFSVHGIFQARVLEWGAIAFSKILSTSCQLTVNSVKLLSDSTFTLHFHALEKEMATHSSVLAWRIPGMGESGGLLSMGSHRVRHD